MITIHTRQNENGNWWCTGTITGYSDKSFNGESIETARGKMVDYLTDKGFHMSDVHWDIPQYYGKTSDENIKIDAAVEVVNGSILWGKNSKK